MNNNKNSKCPYCPDGTLIKQENPDDFICDKCGVICSKENPIGLDLSNLSDNGNIDINHKT